MKLLKLNINNLVFENRIFIMGIAILAIMLYHQNWFHSFPFSLFKTIGYWGPDIFIFISGLGIASSLEKNSIRQFYKNRFWRIVPESVLVGCIRFFLAILLFSPMLRWSYVLLPFGLDMWFIQLIFICYLIAPKLKVGLERYGIGLLLVICLICFLLQPLDLKCDLLEFNLIIYRFPVFVAGMYLYKKEYELEIGEFPRVVLLLAGLIYICVLYYLSSHVYLWHNLGYVSLLLIPILPFIMYLLNLLKRITDKLHISSILNFIGVCSLEVYLCHHIIFEIFYKFSVLETYISAMFAFLLSFLAAFSVKAYKDWLMRIMNPKPCELVKK